MIENMSVSNAILLKVKCIKSYLHSKFIKWIIIRYEVLITQIRNSQIVKK